MGVSFRAGLLFQSDLVTGSSSGTADTEAFRLASGFGGGIGVSFFGANLPVRARSSERGGSADGEEPDKACFFARVVAEVSLFRANFSCLSPSRERDVFSTAEEPVEARLFAAPPFDANLPCSSLSSERGAFSLADVPIEARLLAGAPFFGANLPCPSLTKHGVAELKVDFGANLPLESRCSELVLFSDTEIELVDLRLFLGVRGASS
jgi:hypothetical protein